MKNIFRKSNFPKAPGGNLYEWKNAETVFEITQNGLFAIKIEASAKNAEQNSSKDDDDLSVAIDDFDFGKYERNQENNSWKGFNVSASWNGSALRGGTKTVYFFVNLNKGWHVLQFFADETPILKNIEISEIANHTFELTSVIPAEKIKSARNGIPWLSFVFLGAPSKNITMGVSTKSAKSKGGTDGDNLRVVINGSILANVQAPASNKYKNFYFSGDLKEFDVLSITNEQLAKPLAFENAVELWYDEEPEITNLRIDFFDAKEFIKKYDMENLRKYLLRVAQSAIFYFKSKQYIYSAQFLEHSLQKNPSNLVFSADDPIVNKIKNDQVYKKILIKLKEKISAGNRDGEIWPEDFNQDHVMKGAISFETPDLAKSIHGIRKIEYKASKLSADDFELRFIIFDIYDFQKGTAPLFYSQFEEYLTQIIVGNMDIGEELGILKNYEIEIRITDTIHAC